jgi:hypothetical protein
VAATKAEKDAMNKIVVYMCIGLLLSSCSGIIAARDYKDLTPEQINALKDIGHEVFTCSMVGGPPLGGRTMIVILPKNSKGKFKLLPDCQMSESEFRLGE